MADEKKSLTRRDFLQGTLGAAVGASVLGTKWLEPAQKAAGSSLVAVVRDAKAMDSANVVHADVLKTMLDGVLTRVTGQTTAKDAWHSLFKPVDTIGLVPTDHLNPTHKEVVDAVKSSLIAAGFSEDRATTMTPPTPSWESFGTCRSSRVRPVSCSWTPFIPCSTRDRKWTPGTNGPTTG
jgi:hypothetical protein